MKKLLYKVALLSSTLLLVGCGGNGGGGSSSTLDGMNQSELVRTQSELQSIQNQVAQVLSQLAETNQDAAAKQTVLDELQAKLAEGRVTAADVAAAQSAYDQASARVADQEKKKSDLADQARKLKEKADTLSAAVKLDSALNNAGSAVLSGTFTKDDLATFTNAVNTKTAKELIAPANKFIADIKLGLNTGVKVKDTFSKIIHSPIVDELVIPAFSGNVALNLQEFTEDFVSENARFLTKKDDNWNMFVSSSDVLFRSYIIKVTRGETASDYTVEFPLKKIIENSTNGLNFLGDGGQTYRDVQKFIDNYFKNNPTKIQEFINLNLEVGKPEVLQANLQREVVKLKPVVLDVLGKMDPEWLDGIAESIQEIENVGLGDMKKLKDFMKNVTPMLGALGLSAEAPISASATTSYRKARSDFGGVALNQFALDGNTLNQSYALNMPLRIDLKGSITSGKSSDVVGSVTYNLNGTVMGVVQSYNNTVDLHAETSVLLSQSIGNFFIEAQAGYVGVREGQFSGWEGQRYQATFGYDAAVVSPFIQVEYRPLSIGFSTLNATGVYVGLESDVMTVELADATFTSSVLAKVGYESSSETMFGQSLKPNQSAAAFVEWNAGLKLSQGFEVKSALTLGSKDQSVKLNVAFEQ
jgi:hypothetical protein